MNSDTSKLFLSPVDLNGLTVEKVRDKLTDGVKLDFEAQYCFDVSVMRLKLFTDMYAEALADGIYQIVPYFVTDELKQSILSASKWLFFPMNQGLEKNQVLKFPDAGLKQGLSFYADEVRATGEAGRIVLTRSVAPLVQVVKDAVERIGPHILEELPDMFSSMSVPFSAGVEQLDIVVFDI